MLDRVLDLAAVGLAAEQVGGAQKVLEMAVEYAKVRVQFGRPIGSFQAIKHKCADMLLEVESAKSAAYYGMWCAAELNDELPSVASLAKAYCSRGVLPRHRREHPDPRRHRLHLGAPGAPVLQAGEVVASCCSVTRPTTASCSPSASASDPSGRRLAVLRSHWAQPFSDTETGCAQLRVRVPGGASAGTPLPWQAARGGVRGERRRGAADRAEGARARGARRPVRGARARSRFQGGADHRAHVDPRRGGCDRVRARRSSSRRCPTAAEITEVTAAAD